MTSKLNNEFLLKPSDRLTIFPIEHNDMWEMYKKAVSAFWTPEELDLSKDVDDFNKLNDKERTFIKHILAFFSSSDTIVNINLGERFLNDVQVLEAKFFYAFQMAIENIHSETYSLLIDTYFKDTAEKSEALNAINYMPCIKIKADWCFKWIEDEKAPFSQRLLAFALVEGVFFSGAFCSIFWLKERGLMQGLSFSNELISRDEAMHVEFAVLLYSKIENRLPQSTVHQIVKEAVEVEKIFINDSIPCSMLGMNADLMCLYIEFVADRLLTQLNYDKIWNSSNPFPFMERISIESKSNFFESRVSQYSKANVGSKKNHSELRKFDLEADF
uniref:ribonucleoside-diphosphate reductase n=1 Tax=Virus NIOZ-UU159 TaxID=2763270 RepID=A0A7S9SV92_9VIRU|nr:MAG: ribonucleotide-diphosphate reductase subunit beta [Virus NIOZ-UU159]